MKTKTTKRKHYEIEYFSLRFLEKVVSGDISTLEEARKAARHLGEPEIIEVTITETRRVVK